MKRILSLYHPKLPVFLVYMMQQVEYDPDAFIRWVARLPRYSQVMHRQQLVLTSKARLLILFVYGAGALSIISMIVLITIKQYFVLPVLLLLPLIMIIALYMVILLAWLFIEAPRRRRLTKQSAVLFEHHPAIKIAIAGSYGKTTVKELLNTILNRSKKVAATPGNKNVGLSHAQWISRLDGDEEILIIEYGEGAPGDIGRFARTTRPDKGVITGLAPNHLDHYKTLQAVADDLMSLADYIKAENIYLNAESSDLLALGNIGTRPFHQYDRDGAEGVVIHNVKISITGMKFQASINGGPTLDFETALIGYHLLGPLAVCIALASEFGLSADQIRHGVADTKPFEHRMSARQMHGAWIIDDTYNGNLEGMRAGLELLKELSAKRKIYVTPGLVDQGEETTNAHLEIGRLIAEAVPDRVVLMQNSVTDIIKQGMTKAGFRGELVIETNPLEFYTNLEHLLAAGDLVLMQNDLTDNYT